MTRLPHALIVIDTKKEKIAVEEATRKRIPIIGITSSNSDIGKINHPIVANISSGKSVEFILTKLAEAYKKGRSERKETEEK